MNTRTRVAPLNILAEELCEARLDGEEVLLGSGRGARRPAQLGVAEAAAHFGRYAALDGPGAHRARVPARGVVDAPAPRRDGAPLVPILADMEVLGIAVDDASLGTMSRELYQRIQALEAEMYELSGSSRMVRACQRELSTSVGCLGVRLAHSVIRWHAAVLVCEAVLPRR